MVKVLLFSAALFSLYGSWQCCAAQEVVPVIYLSNDEATKARKEVQDLKSAQDRNNRAAAAWRSFNQNYQAAHPELPGLRFSSDFRVAFARKDQSSSYPAAADATVVELSPEERQRVEALHREMEQAKRVFDQAQKSWIDYQNEFLSDHVQPTGGGSVVTLPNGKTVTIPEPWSSGIVFTPDFRVAVPRAAR